MKSISVVVHQDAMAPLDRWLADALAEALHRPVPRGLARKAIVAGLVTVGGRIARDPGLMLRRGPSVFVRTLEWLPVAESAATLRILFEDSRLIAVDKPSGLPTHETKDPTRPSLTALIEQHVGHRVFVHHRLDAGTSGVVLFAKAAEANSSLAASFAGRTVDKTYVALVHRPPIDWPAVLTIDSPIAVLKNGNVRVDSSGSPAATRVRVLQRGRDRLLVEAKPVTGRKHQIRVHLASVAAPIIGDVRYGTPSSRPSRLMLHAERLEIDHPVTGERLTIVSPRPPEFTVRGEGIPVEAPAVSRPEPPRPRATGPGSKTSDRVSRPGDARPTARRSHKEKKRRTPDRARARGSRH
jgi:23S rRNA pseudouridine1911/1915/1917 synthase